MTNITGLFSDLFQPQKAFVIYKSLKENSDVFVESYDIDNKGRPINAHPLSLEETDTLATVLQSAKERQAGFLRSKGLVPENVLHLDQRAHGHVVWYTPEQKVNLLFKPGLDIPCGEAYVPSLLWKATKSFLHISALKSSERPTAKTPLFHAPFFNINHGFGVCMGTVDVDIEKDCSLEEFMASWEKYFWNSYFSHMIGHVSPVKGNIVQLWQRQIKNQTPFPMGVLKKTGKTIADLIE